MVGPVELPKMTWPRTFRNCPSPPTIGSTSAAPLKTLMGVHLLAGITMAGRRPGELVAIPGGL